MEVPFYYSFKEFKENYENDLKKWKKTYIDGEETDFLNALNNLYYNNYKYDLLGNFIGFKDIEISLKYKNDFIKKGIKNIDLPYEIKTIEEVVKILTKRRITLRYPDEEYLYVSLYKDEVIDWADGLTKEEFYAKNSYRDDFFIDSEVFIQIKDFIFIQYRRMNGHKIHYLKFDDVKYANFKLSIPKIYNFIQEKLNPKIKIETQTPPPDEVEPITLPENIDKIQINGNYQLLAFLFNELIDKGYITAPTYLGKPSHKRTAEMLLKHFEFTNKTEQPSVDNLTNYIKNNTYSMQKQSLFKIPSIKKAND